MKRRYVIFVNCRIPEQVRWWNNFAHWTVDVIQYQELVNTKTRKLVGVFYTIEGVLAGIIAKKSANFYKLTNELESGLQDEES